MFFIISPFSLYLFLISSFYFFIFNFLSYFIVNIIYKHVHTLKGPMITQDMREEWEQMDVDIALKRSQKLLQFTQTGFKTLEKRALEKVKDAEALVEGDQWTNQEKRGLKRVWSD